MRVITLTLFMVATYILVRRRQQDASTTQFAAHFTGVLIAAGMLSLLVKVVVVEGARSIFAAIALLSHALELFAGDAAIVGSAIGFLLASQRNEIAIAGDRLSRKRVTAVEKLQASARQIGAQGAFLGLVLVGVAPPASWPDVMAIFDSVSVKTAAVDVAVQLNSRQRSEGSSGSPVRDIAPSRSQSSDPLMRGFSTPRLDRMAAFTFPLIAETADNALILRAGSAAQPVGLQFRGNPRIREMVRDRAYIGLIDTDQRKNYPNPNALDGQLDETRIQLLGAVQEPILAILGNAVHCVRQYVTRTLDTRVAEFDSGSSLLWLANFARSWTEMEEKAMLATLQHHAITSDLVNAVQQVQRSGDMLGDALDPLIKKLGLHAREGTNDPCPSPISTRLREELAKLSGSTHPGHGGLSPHLTILAAHAFAGANDHTAATKALRDWLDARQRMEALVVARGAASAARRELRAWLDWQRLKVRFELAILHIIEIAAGDSSTVTNLAAGRFHELVLENDLMPLLRRLGESATLNDWRQPKSESTLRCRLPDRQWRQPPIYSYISLMASYLDHMNRFRPPGQPPSAQEMFYADITSDFNFACLAALLPSNEAQEMERHRFMETSIETRMAAFYSLQPPALSNAERQAMLLTMHQSLMQAERAVETTRRQNQNITTDGDVGVARVFAQLEHDNRAASLDRLRRQLDILLARHGVIGRAPTPAATNRQ